MTTQRVQQADDRGPLGVPALRTREAQACGPGAAPPEHADAIRQVAGAVSALAGKVEQLGRRVEAMGRPGASAADRRQALDQAREFVTGLGLSWPAGSGAERVAAELAVARFLAGE